MRVAVVGLGKIGLPLAVQIANRDHHVTGVDIDQTVVDNVNQAVVPFSGEHQLAQKLSESLLAGQLHATTSLHDAVASSEVVVIVVPLVVDDEDQPDFGPLDMATTAIGSALKPGTLVVYETTLPVGTTRERWKPRLESCSGLVEGQDFHVAFSPERVLTGRVFADLRKYPKLIGGLSTEGAERVQQFYQAVLEFDDRPDLRRPNGVWDLGSAEAAELAKLAETTYRDVNIGLANQFARFAEKHHIDIYRVIEACNSQSYSHIHRPGISVGGHCIPVYPRLYLWNDPDAAIVRVARETNASMPRYVVDLAQNIYGDLSGARVVVLGAAYRGGVKETSFSGTFATVEALNLAGATVSVHDPLYSNEELMTLDLNPHTLGQPVDIAVLHTDHFEYRDLRETDLPEVRLVVDGRAILEPAQFPSTTLITLGRASSKNIDARGVPSTDRTTSALTSDARRYRCDCCRGARWRPCFEENGFQLGQCEDCDLLYVGNPPTRTTRMTEMESGHFAGRQKVLGRQRQSASEIARSDAFANYVGVARRYGEAGRWLDVGCGTGQLMLLATSAGYRVEGIELNSARRAAAQAQHFVVHDRPVEQLSLAKESINVITLIDVFSHLVSPRATLIELRRLLAPGGIIILATGESLAPPRKTDLRYWNLGDHLHFLGQRTIHRYAAELNMRIVDHQQRWLPDQTYSRDNLRISGRSWSRNVLKQTALGVPGGLAIIRKVALGKHRESPLFSARIVLQRP